MSDLLSWHRVGVRVVCINADHIDGQGNDVDRLIKGNVYTITKVVLRKDEIGLYLAEVIASNGRGYSSQRFRPARETSIESLLALLHPTPDDARPFFEEIVKETQDA